MDLNTKFLGFDFSPPIVNASGVMGVNAVGMLDVIQSGAGGATSKSINMVPRSGYHNPTVIGLGKEIGIIAAVGLSGEGVVKAKKTYQEYKNRTKAPLIVSFFGNKLEDFGEIAAILDTYPADILEVNISCPNVDGEMGTPISCDPRRAEQATALVRKNTSKPITMKLSASVPNIGLIAKACEAAGADGLSAINSIGPGLLVDPYLRRTTLTNRTGGISGPAARLIALKAINDIYKSVKIPIIGIGGITTGKDAIEAVMCGATLVGIGAGVYCRGIEVFGLVAQEIKEFMAKEGIKSLEEIRGIIK